MMNGNMDYEDSIGNRPNQTQPKSSDVFIIFCLVGLVLTLILQVIK